MQFTLRIFAFDWPPSNREGLVRTNKIFCFGGVKLVDVFWCHEYAYVTSEPELALHIYIYYIYYIDSADFPYVSDNKVL